MQAQEIFIPRKLTQQLLHLAQLSPDEEICGLIGGKNDMPTTCYPVKNVADQPVRRFLLDAKQQIAAFAAMRDNGEALYAIYHSHPHTPPFPSELDRAEAAYSDAVYLIISLNTKGLLEMRGFKIDARQINEIDLILVE